MFKGFIDTTLRDGQQSPLLFDSYTYQFSLNEKKKLVDGLIKLGIRYLEFFSPVVSKTEAQDFEQIKKYIKTITQKKIYLLAHCRCHEKDIAQAIKAGFDGVNLYMNGTQQAQRFAYGKDFSQIKDHIVSTIKSFRKKYPKLYIRFSVEDAFRTKQKDMYAIFDNLVPYVNTFGIPDTVGTATPTIVSTLVSHLRTRYPDIDLECHFHNDRGYAVLNSIAAIKAGVAYVDTSIWGLAERSGIASVTALLFNLYQEDKKLVKNYDISLCYPLNVLMGSILKLHVPYTEPVSITNRTHIAGVHHKAVISMPKIYEAHQLEKFGVTRNQLLLGPLTGWNLIYYYLHDFEYFEVSEEQARKIAAEFKNATKKLSRRLRPEVLLRQIAEQHNLIKITIPEKYLEKRIENLN